MPSIFPWIRKFYFHDDLIFRKWPGIEKEIYINSPAILTKLQAQGAVLPEFILPGMLRDVRLLCELP